MMESRFVNLRVRDNSVSMLRVKMSRRRSQSQKENRERAVNTRRQLDKIPELATSSLDHVSIIQEKKAKPAKNLAAEERLKQLERWKERKALEKDKKERERKCIFKTGLYHPKDTFTFVSLPVVPAAPNGTNETNVNMAPSQNTRVTRSMKRLPQVQKLPKTLDVNAVAMKAQHLERSTRSRVAAVKPAPTVTKAKVRAVQPALRTLLTRSTNRPPVTGVSKVKGKPMDKFADARTTTSGAAIEPLAPPSVMHRNSNASANNTFQPSGLEESKLKDLGLPEAKSHRPNITSCSEEEYTVADQASVDSVPAVDSEAPNSFAPEGFVFQAPAGLSSFKFEPLTPRSADTFLSPSPSFSFPRVPVFSAEPPTLPKSHHSLSPRSSPTMIPATPCSILEAKHNVPYFREEIANETDRLTVLCVHWESKVEDESIPEEMRDCMRTAIGQARLLMKERFNQFSGLVDDCELGRGEKITTCTDLQGFWDMVYYQVEDVNKKFDSLREAESRGWVEEHKPPSRQRKVVKKSSAASSKATGNKASAKSRLAAVKAALKAKQQAAEAEKAAKDAEETACLNYKKPQLQAEARIPDRVMFDGGLFKVESPVKSSDSVRRSSRLSAAVLASPSSNTLTPRRITHQSLALAVAPPSQHILNPALLQRTLNQTPVQKSQSQCGTPHSSKKKNNTVNVSLCFIPVKEVLSDETQPDENLAQQSETPDGAASFHELGTPMLIESYPTVSAADEQVEPAEAVHLDIPVCPNLSPSPCKIPPPSSQISKPSSSPSFMLSPYVTPSQPSISTQTAVQSPAEDQKTVCCTLDGSLLEEIPGLDFERYLQPSQRCSLSPRESVVLDILSPLVGNEEMESPMGQSGDLLCQQEPALSGMPLALTFQSPRFQTPESALLFTPDLKDRIRQSVCPSDLMVFTPPSNL